MIKHSRKIKVFFILAFVLLTLTISFASSGATHTDEKGVKWSFTPNADGTTATITGATLSKQTSEFNIPATVSDGTNVYTVTAIGSSAFNKNEIKKLVFGKLTIPNTVVSIGSYAFANTYIFGKVEIPESVTSIGSNAFQNCDGINEVVLPSKLDSISGYTFSDCYALRKINIENVSTFESYAFSNCQALYEIEFGSKDIKIKENAFLNCVSLSKPINLSAVTDVESNAFKGCSRIESVIIPNNNNNSATKSNIFAAFPDSLSLTSLMVSEENGDFSSIDGILCSKDGKTLIRYPAARTDTIFTIPDSITTIGKNAFNGTKYLEEIRLNNVTTLEEEAFAGSSIVKAYIPDSIRIVSFDAFKNCENLATVIFEKGVQAIGSGALTGTTAIKLVIVKNNMCTLPASKAQTYYASDYNCVSHIYGYADKAPTCTEPGYNKCIICDRYEYVKEINHSGAIIEQAERTCTSNGYQIVECLYCNETVTVVTDKAIGHISDGQVFSKNAEYKVPSFRYSTCIVCDCTYIVDYIGDFLISGDVNCDGKINIADLRDLNAYIKDNSSVEISTKNADLTRDGAVDENDAKILQDYLSGIIDSLPQVTVPCSNHGKKTTKTVVEVSCSTNGFVIRYCSNCGILTDEINNPAKEHTFESTLTINSTCRGYGQKVSHCTVCDHTIIETIDKLPHSQNWYTLSTQRGYEYNLCSFCGNLESRVVDYSTYDSLIDRIPAYYDKYFKPETLALITPVLSNYEKTLTQAEVDENVRILADALANAQYVVYDAPTIFLSEVPTDQVLGYQATEIIVAYTGEDGRTYVEAMDYNGQVKVRGRGSSGHNPRPYNIKFSSKVDLFGMGAGKKYCLLSNAEDETRIRNALMFELSNILGIQNSCKYEIVDLYAQGTYRGSYLLVTPADVGEDRVDIDEDNDILLEIEKEWDSGSTDQKDCYLVYSPIFGIRFIINSPEKVDMSGDAYSNMWVSVANFDFAIKSGDWNLIQQYIDVDSMAKYYILHEYLKEIDIIWDSTRFYIQDGMLYGGPGWDFDYSMFWGATKGGTAFAENAYYKNQSSSQLCVGGTLSDSATGEWASLTWYRPSIDSTDDKIYFCSLYKHSPDFVKLICQYVAKYEDELSLLYEDELDKNGRVVTQNVIDSFVKGEGSGSSLNRDRQKRGVLLQTYNQYIESLRDWLERRNNWMQDYYAEKLKSMK